MNNNKSTAIKISSAILMLNSEVLLAADGASSLLPPMWPLFAVIIFMFVFRKQLNCNPPVDLGEKPENPPPVAQLTEETATLETVDLPEEKTASESIDGSDLRDHKQCQASTSKKTRCRREIALEDASLVVDGKSYLITVCGQHNTKKLKAYPGLIK